MTDELIELIEELVVLNNRALALGVDINEQMEAAAQKLNVSLDKNFAEEIARIKAAFRRPQSDAVH